MGKWIALIVVVAAALIAFLVFRRKSAAATSGAFTTAAPSGATAGGVLATLTAPPRPEGTPANTPVMAAPPPAPSPAPVYTYEVQQPPPKPVVAALPPVGYGTVVPAKPSTQALAVSYNPQTVFGGFSSMEVGIGQSFYVTPRSTLGVAPAAPAPTVTPMARSTSFKF